MKVYYEFSPNLEDMSLLFLAEKKDKFVYKATKVLHKNTRLEDVKGLVDWFNMCLEDVEKL